MANKIDVDSYPGEAPYDKLGKGDLFHLCDAKGDPKVWIKGGTGAIRLFDGASFEFPESTLVTKVPDGTLITIIVGKA